MRASRRNAVALGSSSSCLCAGCQWCLTAGLDSDDKLHLGTAGELGPPLHGSRGGPSRVEDLLGPLDDLGALDGVTTDQLYHLARVCECDERARWWKQRAEYHMERARQGA
jgi:hypothetical protein